MTMFIAEVSSNHNQSLDRCFDFIDCAKNIGCDSIKFQLFKIEKLFSPEILSKSQAHKERKKWELPLEFIPEIYNRCKEKDIAFSCTPFYLEAVDELVDYVSFFKIASYELLWDDLLVKCARTGKPVIISTGMATIPEILHAVEILKSNGCKEPMILHCSSAYPTPIDSANLSAIKTIRDASQCKVGWSDHTVSSSVIFNSILRWGAEIIEFHLDIDGEGYEYSRDGHCWLPNQIQEVIEQLEIMKKTDGNGMKEPNDFEIHDRIWRADPFDGLRPHREIREKYEEKN